MYHIGKAIHSVTHYYSYDVIYIALCEFTNICWSCWSRLWLWRTVVL